MQVSLVSSPALIPASVVPGNLKSTPHVRCNIFQVGEIIKIIHREAWIFADSFDLIDDAPHIDARGNNENHFVVSADQIFEIVDANAFNDIACLYDRVVAEGGNLQIMSAAALEHESADIARAEDDHVGVGVFQLLIY